MPKDNVSQVISIIVRSLDIKVTEQSIQRELQQHPNYHSLLAISDIFSNWSVPNVPYQLDHEDLPEVPLPFIAFLKRERFAVVHQLDDAGAVISNERYDKKKITAEEFKQEFSGNILAIEKDETSGEPDYPAKRRRELLSKMRLPAVIAGISIVFLSALFLNPAFVNAVSWHLVSLTIFKVAGVAASVLLLMQSIDVNNPLVQKLCGNDNTKNCNAILSSPAAKIIDGLSWSEVGFAYFAGSLLTLIFSGGDVAVAQTLAIMNLLALPYTVYSIYYQWKVAGQWCTFCCVVQGVLWLEFFAFLPSLTAPFQLPTVAGWAAIGIGMLLPVLTWVFLKPFFLDAQRVKSLTMQLRDFKYNSDLFNDRLNKEVKYALPNVEDTLIVGNPEAENTITIVSNPNCQPCAKAHKALDGWMPARQDVKLQVVFATGGQPDDPRTKVAAHLMSLQAENDPNKLKTALDGWYELKQKKFEDWAARYPVASPVESADSLKAQADWNKMAEISGTPTIFINGRRLPSPYQPEDIKYFI